LIRIGWETIIDVDGPALDPAEFCEAIAKSSKFRLRLGVLRRGTHKYPDLPHCRRLLCACGERPSHGAAAGKANKFAPSHGPSQVLRSGMVAGQTGSLEVVESALGDVRFGSKADIALVKSDVRFTPKRRHR